MRISVTNNRDETEREIDLNRLLFAEGRALEKATGLTIAEINEHMNRGSLAVLQGVIWLALKRETPTLKYSDLDEMELADFEVRPIQEPTPDDGEGEGGEATPDFTSPESTTRKAPRVSRKHSKQSGGTGSGSSPRSSESDPGRSIA